MLSDKADDVRGVILSHLKLAEYYLRIKSIDSSNYHLNKSKILAKSVDANDLLLEVCYLEYQVLTSINQYWRAAEVLNTYQLLKDSLLSLEFSSNVDRIKASLLAEINSKENQLLIQSQLASEKTGRTRLVLLATLSVLLIIALCFIYFYRESKRLVKHQGEKDALIDKLNLRNKNLREFNSVVSHNLREPLTQIIGYSKFYENGNTGMETDEIINHIKKSSFRIDQTIRDISTLLTDVEPNSKDYKLIDLKKAVSDIVGTFNEKFTSEKPQITFKGVDEVSFMSYWPFINDIFYHLISNAIRFRHPDRQLDVTFNFTKSGGETTITFSDNGRGLDLNRTKGKLFKMYQKFHPDSPGRGVGLYIVKSRVDALKGEITVTSTIDVGTSFTIRLPAS